MRQQYDISFTEPYFLDRELAAGFDLFKTELDVNGSIIPYQEDTNGVKFRLGYALTEKWQHTLNYTLRSRPMCLTCSPALPFLFFSSKGRLRNRPSAMRWPMKIATTRTIRPAACIFRLNQDVAGLGGDTHYLRDEVHAGFYYPVAPKWTLSLLGAGGYIFGFDEDVRIEDRFFLGGPSFRGFEDYGMGPHDKSTGDSLGGNAYYVITPELSFPLGLPEDLGFNGAPLY